MNINEMIREFRRPFSPNDVEFKIQTVGQKACLCVAYVDARHVQERLNKVTGGRWENSFREIFAPKNGSMEIVAVEATICVSEERHEGIHTKEEFTYEHADVGSLDNVNEGSHGLKALYSDAFKRAAVHFGIAVSLYTLPTMFLEKNSNEVREKNGKPVGITTTGSKKLQGIYEKEMTRLVDEFGEIYD